MKYILNQFNQMPTTETSESSSAYMEYIYDKRMKAGTRNSLIDYGVYGIEVENFKDECAKFPNGILKSSDNYYFKGKIKRASSTQEFYIYLVHDKDGDPDPLNTDEIQYLKNIVVQKQNNNSEWVDVELIFNPVHDNFNCILFELKRTAEDYQKARKPIIVYEELSIIKNAVPAITGKTVEQSPGFIKIGVQSRPGLKMCINGQEIHVGKTAHYEIKNGIIVVDNFSIISPSIDSELEKNLKNITKSVIYLNPENKIRNIQGFSLDYLYKTDEEVQG